MRVTIITALCCASLAARLIAADVWVVGGIGESQTGSCTPIRWLADPLLYNTGVTVASVRIVHVSNGAGIDNVVASLRPGSVRGAIALGAGADAALWITHFDLPDGIGVEGRMEYFAVNKCTLFPPDPSPLGKVTTPVFTWLVPAGQEQIHFGTDLARQRARLNISVYNAGSVPALATAAVHLPECHEAKPVSNAFIVPADTAMQVPLGEVDCGTRTWWPSFVSVVVDQPSLSFVSSLSNEMPPSVSIALSQP